jgi:excisionase family DNA binding protein
MEKKLLTAKQVQELLHVDRTTIYRMLKDGRLTGIKVGQRWRFSEQEVNELLSGVIRQDDEPLLASVDVLPLHCMQPVQDVFAEIADVGSVTTGVDGHPLTRISNPCDFCKLIMGSEDGRQACAESWHTLAQQTNQSPEFISCHAGLQYARARIEVGGEKIAILVAGQFYTNNPEPEEEKERLQALAKKYHIDVELLSRAARKIPMLDARKVPQISGWLERVAKTFEQISSERASLKNRLEQISVISSFKLENV